MRKLVTSILNGGVDVDISTSSTIFNLPFVVNNANITYSYSLGIITIAFISGNGISSTSTIPNFEYKITIIPQK